MNILLFDAETIDQLQEPQDENSRYVKRFFTPFIKDGSLKYIENIRTQVAILQVEDVLVPLTINNEETGNAYVVSPYTHYVDYAREELVLIKNAFLKKTLEVLLSALGKLLRFSRVNKVIHINNWMFSTNLYMDLSEEQIRAITTYLTNRFPHHVLIFRSINQYVYQDIYTSLQKKGDHMIASRQVYFSKHRQKMKGRQREHVNRDYSLIRKKGYEIIDLNENHIGYARELLDLYNDLYIKKYSKWNPKFTEDFIRLSLKEDLLVMKGVKQGDQFIGCLGYWKINGVMTTPLFGYNTDLEKGAGVYRVLSALLNEKSEKKGYLLNMSSGAADFKINRGGEGVIEYSGVYIRHLPLRRKLGFMVLQGLINGIGVPLLKNQKL